MSDNLFTPPEGETPTEPKDQEANYLSEFVGEGKKYKSEQELAKAYKHADTYIESLKRELSEFRQEVDKRASLEELVEKITKATNTNSAPQPNGSESVTQRSNDHNEQPPQISPKDIEKMVAEKLEQETNRRAQASNLNSIKKELHDAWGPGYVDKLNSKAKELGLSPDQLNNLAATQPTLFKTAIGLNNKPAEQVGNFTPPQNRNVQRPVSNDPNRRNKAYYDKLRKENLNQYLSSKTQVQMHKDAMEQGDSFYS